MNRLLLVEELADQFMLSSPVQNELRNFYKLNDEGIWNISLELNQILQGKYS